MTVIRFPEQPDPRPVTERVSEEVRALIGRNRISQTTLADWLGLTQSAVSARLRGTTEWKVAEIDVLARRFGVHPAVLLGGYAEGPQPGIAMPPAGRTDKGRRGVRRQGLEPRTRYIRPISDLTSGNVISLPARTHCNPEPAGFVVPAGLAPVIQLHPKAC